MIHEVLPPGVQNADGPYLRAKMFLIIGEFHKRLGDGAEKKIVHDLPIHQYQTIQFRGDGKNYMEVLDRKKVLSTGLNPPFFF